MKLCYGKLVLRVGSTPVRARVGPSQVPWPWPCEGRASSQKSWPNPGPTRVGSGRPWGQQGQALPPDSVIVWDQVQFMENNTTLLIQLEAYWAL